MIEIKNLNDLKDFVINPAINLIDKTKVVNQCLNIVLLGHIETIAELIKLIDTNNKNEYRKIILGNGINPDE